MTATHAATPGSATDCTCGRTFASHMGRRNHLTAAAKRAANEAAAAAAIAQHRAEAEAGRTAASRPEADDAATLAAWVPKYATIDAPASADEADQAAWYAANGAQDPEQGIAAEEPATCEHGIPMTDPCRPCAIAGHEPVDLDDEPTQTPGTWTMRGPRGRAAHVRAARAEAARRADDEPTELTDNRRHLADCRACALQLPDGHEYASLIDVPLTAEELRTLATRDDVDPVIRQGAADALDHELHEAADAVGRTATARIRASLAGRPMTEEERADDAAADTRYRAACRAIDDVRAYAARTAR